MLSCDVLAFAMWMKQWNSSLLHPPFASDEILWCNKCRSDFNSCIVSMKRNDEAICLHRHAFECVCVCWLVFMWIDSNEMKCETQCKTQCNAMLCNPKRIMNCDGMVLMWQHCHVIDVDDDTMMQRIMACIDLLHAAQPYCTDCSCAHL